MHIAGLSDNILLNAKLLLRYYQKPYNILRTKGSYLREISILSLTLSKVFRKGDKHFIRF